MGYPDAAFAVLKNGLHSELVNYRYEEVYLKDQAGIYGANFGDTWLSHMLKNSTGKNITTQNCYLPYK